MEAVSPEAIAPTSPSADAAPWMLWVGRVLSAVPVLMLLMSATMKLTQNPKIVEGWTPKFGFPGAALIPVGVVELLCALIYAVPQTSVLGAILITGYLGGAVATHVRVAEVFVTPLMLGVFAWAGLFLRDRRVRDLIPLKR